MNEEGTRKGNGDGYPEGSDDDDESGTQRTDACHLLVWYAGKMMNEGNHNEEHGWIRRVRYRG